VTADPRPLLVGEGPNATGCPDQRLALTGRVMQRLCAWSGLTTAAYLRRFERRNLFHTRAEAERWSAPAARGRATELAAGLECHRELLLLGRRVAAAFGLDGHGFHTWHQVGEHQALLLPHPSGLNHHWNETQNRDRMGQEIREAAERFLARDPHFRA
jgi:hypothetical protein